MLSKLRNFTIPSSTNSILFSRPISFAFSTSAKNTMADWQYNTKIQQSLREDNINQALRYLVNSCLDGKVLDRHIFRHYFLKVQQNQYSISYQEIGYKLYRQYFKPHMLVLDWMNSLARSRDEGIIKLLTEDFKSINFQIPNCEKVNQEQQDKKSLNKYIQSIKNTSSEINADDKQKIENIVGPQAQNKAQSLQSLAKNSVSQQHKKINSGSYDLQQQFQSKQQLLSVIKHIGSLVMDLNPKITLHNVQINYTNEKQQYQTVDFQKNQDDYQYSIRNNSNNKQQDKFEPTSQQQQDQDNNQYEYEDQFYQQRIQKIKIQKIQIVIRNGKIEIQQDKRKSNDQ